MSKKYNPIMEDNIYWRYQGLLESFHQTLKDSPDFLMQNENFVHSLAHIARKVYEMGYCDAMKHYEPNVPRDEKDVIKNRKKMN